MLTRSNMPSVTYLRLDGSISPGVRHEVVTTFNNDPSIDVLLLTTQVGGLGLNLTGADTVSMTFMCYIFLLFVSCALKIWHVMWVPVTIAWHALGLWKEVMASRYGG
jgi:hypothetical protein